MEILMMTGGFDVPMFCMLNDQDIRVPLDVIAGEIREYFSRRVCTCDACMQQVPMRVFHCLMRIFEISDVVEERAINAYCELTAEKTRAYYAQNYEDGEVDLENLEKTIAGLTSTIKFFLLTKYRPKKVTFTQALAEAGRFASEAIEQAERPPLDIGEFNINVK